MYLLDTNIFLEILLAQNKKEVCKKFISDNSGNCSLSDFTLFSIGIVLFRSERYEDYSNFFTDVSSTMKVFSVTDFQHLELPVNAKNLKFDFDDAYQYQTAKYFYKKITGTSFTFLKSLSIVTIVL